MIKITLSSRTGYHIVYLKQYLKSAIVSSKFSKIIYMWENHFKKKPLMNVIHSEKACSNSLLSHADHIHWKESTNSKTQAIIKHWHRRSCTKDPPPIILEPWCSKIHCSPNSFLIHMQKDPSKRICPSSINVHTPIISSWTFHKPFKDLIP